jgi:hypothetical protein
MIYFDMITPYADISDATPTFIALISRPRHIRRHCITALHCHAAITSTVIKYEISHCIEISQPPANSCHWLRHASQPLRQPY